MIFFIHSTCRRLVSTWFTVVALIEAEIVDEEMAVEGIDVVD